MAVKNLLGALTIGLFSLSLTAGSALAQATSAPAAKAKDDKKDDKKHDHKHDEKKHDDKMKDGEKKKDGEKAKIGMAAPAFKLQDTDGKEVDLAALTKSGKIVVLEWYNPTCPYIVKHHKTNMTFNEMNKKYADKGVVFIAVCSNKAGSPGSGKETLAKSKTDFKMAYQIVMDESGEVGKSYGAKTTPHCFVIGKDGKLAYQGAIDSDSSADTTGKTNYVAKALDELLANTSVSTPETKPYGCTVKY